MDTSTKRTVARLLAFLLLPIAAAACSFPFGGECEEIWSTETTCDGNVIVTSACHGGGSPDVNRTDCTDTGQVCLQEDGWAACVTPCASNDDCGAAEYCSTTTETRGGGTCAPSGNSYDACDVSNPRSCMTGLRCVSTQEPTCCGDGGSAESSTIYACE
jgi:hypothetical protein